MQRWVGGRHRSVACRGVALLLFVLAGCASKPQPLSIVGLWAAQEIAGKPLVADTRVTLSLYGDGKAVGRAGCNNYSTSYQRTGDGISFAPLITTKMACAPEVMEQEQLYLDALAHATRAERRADSMLALTTDSGTQLVFRREEAAALADARARGVDFRALGQEPAWVVELKLNDHITAMLDYGATPLLLPTPKGEVAADGAETYDATTDTDHLVLTIRTRPCVDPMSGDPHPSTVELMVNDKNYQGCGDWLE